MVILVILFILLFAFSLAALGITKNQQRDVLITGWSNSQSSTKESIQFHLDCCGFEDKNITSGGLGHPPCKKVEICILVTIRRMIAFVVYDGRRSGENMALIMD